MRNVSRLLNLTLLIILLLASCDVKVQSKSDVDQLCQANEHEKLYEWVIIRLSSSTIAEIERDDHLLSDAISCIISHYRSLDSTSSEASTIRMWLSNMESIHFSRSGVRELEIIPRIFLSNQYQFQEFDKLFKLYIENETNNTPSVIDSMFHYYQGDQFRAAYDDFVSLRLTPQNQYVTLKSLLAKLSPYVQANEGSDGTTWCDSIMESLNIEIERAKKIAAENAKKTKVFGDKLQKAENDLEKLQKEFDRIKNYDKETTLLERKVNTLGSEVDQAYHENRIRWISGYIIGLSSQTRYSNIYECSDNGGNHFLLETFYSSFNSQGSFSLYAKKQPDVAITTVNGFRQNWAKWAEVSEERYYEYMEDRIGLKKELAEAKKLLKKRISRTPKNTAQTVKNLKRKITEASLQVVNIKARLGDLRLTTNLTLKNSVADIDGNSYGTVVIGNQVWMTENLKVTHYRDGTAIPNLTSKKDWARTNRGAYVFYDNNHNNGNTYGALYNWYAVSDSRNIAPAGWHVPTDAEWKELEMFLGMSQSESNSIGYRGTNEGSKLSGNADLWNARALESNSEFGSSGFTALASGLRHYNYGHFNDMGDYGYFWSATEYRSSGAWCRLLSNSHSDISRYSISKKYGYAVRLLRD